MGIKVKDRGRKSHTYYFFDDIISIKYFHSNNVKIDEKSKIALLYYIEYGAIKDLKYVKNNSVNILYLTFHRVNGYFEEINKNKFLTLVPTNKSKGIIKNIKNCGVKSEI